jgi:transcriptional regulator with XRE-family HTH domain
MSDFARENLERLLAAAGLSIHQAAEQTGVDERTIRGILGGKKRKKPHARTLHRLAEGLGVSVEEFFVDPSQLLYRRFDRRTNPMVEEVLESQPELFAGWSEADFDELHSRVGAGGPLTREGAITAVRHMNRKRQLHEKLDLLLESSHAKLIGGIVELLHEQVVVNRD